MITCYEKAWEALCLYHRIQACLKSSFKSMLSGLLRFLSFYAVFRRNEPKKQQLKLKNVIVKSKKLEVTQVRDM